MDPESLAEYLELSHVVKASEDWEPGYRKDQRSFRRLTQAEASMEMKLRRYLQQFSLRARAFVDWDEYRHQAVKAYDVVVKVKDPDFQKELTVMLSLIVDDLQDATEAGFEASAALTRIPVGVPDMQAGIVDSVRGQSEKLITRVSQTTRDLMHSSIQQSIQLGETDQQAADRLAQYLDSPARALTIARTEAVKAYSSGVKAFGKATGAVSKTWHCVADPCLICEQNDEQTVGIDDDFSSGDDTCPAHPNCKCNMTVNYADGTDGLD